jgi:rubrerythrin
MLIRATHLPPQSWESAQIVMEPEKLTIKEMKMGETATKANPGWAERFTFERVGETGKSEISAKMEINKDLQAGGVFIQVSDEATAEFIDQIFYYGSLEVVKKVVRCNKCGTVHEFARSDAAPTWFVCRTCGNSRSLRD